MRGFLRWKDLVYILWKDLVEILWKDLVENLWKDLDTRYFPKAAVLACVCDP